MKKFNIGNSDTEGNKIHLALDTEFLWEMSQY